LNREALTPFFGFINQYPLVRTERINNKINELKERLPELFTEDLLQTKYDELTKETVLLNNNLFCWGLKNEYAGVALVIQ